ncbi:hypothetical protein KIPB_014092, partial [Kipferlia bialata]|eukprot:g14092.t1
MESTSRSAGNVQGRSALMIAT